MLGTTEKWTGFGFKSGLVSVSLVDIEVPKREGNGLDHLLSPPNADFHDVHDDIRDQ